jgi:hypothetical protein
MTNRYQQRAALWLCEERHEALGEMDLHRRSEIDRKAREIRAENARRMAAAGRRN